MECRRKHTKEHEAAVIGDTVGDPLKDTSGPSLNILIKLMAILSLVSASFFQRTAVFIRVLEPTTVWEELLRLIFLDQKKNNNIKKRQYRFFH